MMAEFLPRFSASLESIADERKVARALLEGEAADVRTARQLGSAP